MQTAFRNDIPAPALAPALSPVSPLLRPERESPTLGTVRTFTKDEEIFMEGDNAAFVYKVVSGGVRTCKLLNDGRRQIAAFHLLGDFFGIEVGQEHRFTAEALGDCKVIAYRRRGLDVLSGGETLSEQLMTALMRALERAQAHMLLLGRKSAQEKIAAFLLDLAEREIDHRHIELPMARIDVADYLGLTIETVSRTLTQLERQGVIAMPAHRRSIMLKDKAALQRLDA
ncbi:helix-turn-helix domain-containing protein [Microvirga yunnanensis]|uniref:helix-turn-helix domain-containing protein n=2 Tax=Microvirga TaxID=186650 RepID=UPI0021C7AEB5|nr:helix-turn-helix domain-containing protein [Microvirga sp. HBU65207]